MGQHPKEQADTVTVLEKIGHFLDDENQRLFDSFKKEGYQNIEISKKIADELDVIKILKRSAKTWDGGYTIAGMFGHGDAFVMRDPAGIRPAFYYQDDEVVVVTSERPTIQTAFDVLVDEVKEIQPGHALIIKKNGQVSEEMFQEPTEKRSCAFERIYFSRGSDKDVYAERKKLGHLLCPKILEEIKYDIKNTVFSFIPNTAEVSFYGMVEGIHEYVRNYQKEILLGKAQNLSDEEMDEVLSISPRFEKLNVKDAKLRTFITQDATRQELVQHVYDTTYGLVRNDKDTVVVVDDSIVRGTTMRESILTSLGRLKPKRIVVVSSAPQIRYPDCYGMDMSIMNTFVAFEAAISLLKKQGKQDLIDKVYEKCKNSLNLPKEEVVNHVKEIYAPFNDEEISDEIANLIKPSNLKIELKVIFQSIENLHKACPHHLGDWYFSGNYPTPGGNRVVNKAFINWMEGNNERGYFSR